MIMRQENVKGQKEAISAASRRKPTLLISSEDLPEVRKWKVGKEYSIEMTVRQKGIREEGEEMVAELEIVEAEECEYGD